MRIALSLALIVPLALAACSVEAPDSGKAAPTPDAVEGGAPDDAASGTVYGEPIGEAPLVTLAELNANVSDYEGERVRVEGLIIDVCAKRGCWMNIGAEEGSDYVRFKVTDGVMVKNHLVFRFPRQPSALDLRKSHVGKHRRVGSRQ